MQNTRKCTPFLGSRVSLVSASDVRYEGVLYTIDEKESTVALQNVRCMGTEERQQGSNSIPPSDTVYEFIIFKGENIKKIHVAGDPDVSPPNDPAILGLQQNKLAGSSRNQINQLSKLTKNANIDDRSNRRAQEEDNARDRWNRNSGQRNYNNSDGYWSPSQRDHWVRRPQPQRRHNNNWGGGGGGRYNNRRGGWDDGYDDGYSGGGGRRNYRNDRRDDWDRQPRRRQDRRDDYSNRSPNRNRNSRGYNQRDDFYEDTGRKGDSGSRRRQDDRDDGRQRKQQGRNTGRDNNRRRRNNRDGEESSPRERRQPRERREDPTPKGPLKDGPGTGKYLNSEKNRRSKNKGEIIIDKKEDFDFDGMNKQFDKSDLPKTAEESPKSPEDGAKETEKPADETDSKPEATDEPKESTEAATDAPAESANPTEEPSEKPTEAATPDGDEGDSKDATDDQEDGAPFQSAYNAEDSFFDSLSTDRDMRSQFMSNREKIRQIDTETFGEIAENYQSKHGRRYRRGFRRGRRNDGRDGGGGNRRGRGRGRGRGYRRRRGRGRGRGRRRNGPRDDAEKRPRSSGGSQKQKTGSD